MKRSCNDLTTEDYSLWLLGQLEDPESSLIREHFDGDCAKCAEGVRQGAGFWSAYGAATSSASPSPRLRARVLAAVEDRPKVVSFWRYAAALAAGIVLTAAVAWQLRKPDSGVDPRVADLQSKLSAAESEIARLAAGSNTRLTEQVRALERKVAQIDRERDSVVEALSRTKAASEQNTRLIALLNAPTVKLVRLSGTEAAPKATGYAILAEGRRLIFTGAGLPALPSGKVAQLWLLRGRGPAIVSAGTFPVSGDQTTIEFADPSALTDVRGLAVTEEPRGGSQLPTGHKLLIGTARS